MLRVTSISAACNRSPYKLARALAGLHSSDEVSSVPIFSEEDNGWAAGSFVVQLLLHSEQRRGLWDRGRCKELLGAAESPITIESLEERFWVRFVAGQLEIHARDTHADIEEIFKHGMHEYLTDCLRDMDELGTRIQRAYLGAV